LPCAKINRCHDNGRLCYVGNLSCYVAGKTSPVA
jgi:hypothetical protein